MRVRLSRVYREGKYHAVQQERLAGVSPVVVLTLRNRLTGAMATGRYVDPPSGPVTWIDDPEVEAVDWGLEE